MTVEVEPKPERFEPEESDKALLNWQVAIIDDVLINGLKSARTLFGEGRLYLASADLPVNGFISGYRVYFRYQIKEALYESVDSIFPVVSERKGEKRNDGIYASKINRSEKEILQKKMWSSFLVVSQLSTRTGSVVISGRETVNRIYPEQFSWLIFPEDVWGEYSQTRIPGQELTIPTKIVTRSIRRKIPSGLKPHLFELPDYETALKEVFAELDQPIWVHAVRLPIAEDLTG